MLLEGFVPYREEDVGTYVRRGWWPGRTFGDVLDKATDVYPEKEAVVDDAGRFSYAEIRDKVDRLALALADLGLKAPERALVQLPNWHEFIVAYFALQKIGVIPVILIARYRQYEINHLAKMSGASAWIVAERFRGTDYLPIIEDVLQANPRVWEVVLCRSSASHPYRRYESLIEGPPPDREQRRRLEGLRPDPTQVAHMGPTGGTTGIPKIAPHTHNNLLCKIEYSALASEFNQETVCLVNLPVAHDLPFANGICAVLFTFGKLVLSNQTDPESICRIIQRERVNAVIWVPTLAYRVFNSGSLGDCRLGGLKKIYCGGSASSEELIHAAIEHHGFTFLAGYGGTEGMLTLTRSHCDTDTVCRTIGKPTCPYDIY